MRYEQIVPARFLSRPNRFIALAELGGREIVCHVKNTGRCRELLPGAEIWLQHMPAPERKTAYDLIAVRKGDQIVNMDSNAPNIVVREWLASGGAGSIPSLIRSEVTHGDSRFDLYFESAGRVSFLEVKGVTLEEDGVALFPDAPTERGVKHLKGLCRCVEEGFGACAVFLVQMKGVSRFEPNRRTHPAFAEALAEARATGVRLIALDSLVTPDEIRADRELPILL